MKAIEQLKIELKAIIESLETAQDKQEHGKQALSKIEQILNLEPFDIHTRILRMQLHTDWVFNDINEIIIDAEFVINNDEFGKDKMAGYDWLSDIYRNHLSMPEKAIETIIEQLLEVPNLFEEHYIRDHIEARLLSEIGFINYDTGNKQNALKLWEQSYEKYPYIHERNAVAGLLSLELKNWNSADTFLLRHFDWCFETEDGYRLEYGLKLKALYDNNELSEQPNLIALLYHVIRNEDEAFNLENNLDFFYNHLPKLEEWAVKFPENSMLWTAIGNTYFVDSKNYEKALHAYTKMLEGDNPTKFASLDRIIKSAKKTNEDFTALPLKFTGASSQLYNHLTDMPEGKKKKKKKLYSDIACKYGEACFRQYKDYFTDEKGSAENNQPHLFAMSCNNYGLALERYNNVFNKDDENERIKLAAYYASVHIEGYLMSPFLENLENGAQGFYEAQKYEECIKYFELYLEEYRGDISLLDIQDSYWYIIFSHVALDNFNEAKATYEKSKQLYLETGSGVRNATVKFIFIAKEYFSTCVNKKHAYLDIIPELEWFLTQDSLVKIEPVEIGVVNFYLGVCYKETGQKEQAINAFRTCVELLKDVGSGYYFNKSQEATAKIKELGGSVKPKGKSLLQRLLRK